MSYSRACDFREEWIYPQRARTPKDYWVFVVNQEGARQPVQVEICYQRYNGKEEPCNIGIPNTGDVSTSCKQRFISRRMLVVGSNQIEPEEVLMPSCCVCYIRRNDFGKYSSRKLIPNRDRRNTFDIASRRGGTNTAESQPVGVHPPGGSAIGFIRQPPQHVNHNIRSNGGFNYHNLFQNGGH
ncbi:protein spaetzle 5-like isoform X1 [Palaemon carinicauda]|uniref:protein spaetzle 5-like isoform X1 n=1 Tax=Palaemon carinicauda TaxID=392227 RepID=UPI0035B5FA67